MLTEAIIIAGGLGTRLRSVVSEKPKSMAPINGKPFLEYLVAHFKNNGITRIVFSVGYMSDHITEHFGDNFEGCEIAYAYEDSPLGTGGAIKNAMTEVKSDTVLVTNGDSLFITDIQEQYQEHLAQKATATLAVKPMKDFDRYGTIEVDTTNQIKAFKEKQPTTEGLINGGVYIIDKAKFNQVDLPEKFSIEKDFYEAKVDELQLFAHTSTGYFLDIGIPEDFELAQDEFKQFTFH